MSVAGGGFISTCRGSWGASAEHISAMLTALPHLFPLTTALKLVTRFTRAIDDRERRMLLSRSAAAGAEDSSKGVITRESAAMRLSVFALLTRAIAGLALTRLAPAVAQNFQTIGRIVPAATLSTGRAGYFKRASRFTLSGRRRAAFA